MGSIPAMARPTRSERSRTNSAAAAAFAADDPRLVDAAKANDLPQVQSLLKAGASANSTAPDGSTALHWAIHRDNLTMLDALLAAREAGKPVLDGVYNDIKNAEGFTAECRQGADMGFDGKTLIHPDQVTIANDTWAPNEAEVEHARRVIAAFDEALAAWATP